MKGFFKNILQFAALPVLLLLCSVLIIRYTSSTIDYSLNPGITTLYCGDSHLQYAVNDSLLPNSKNISNSGESFYFSYFKLKKLFENNKQIKQLYLGISYHSISDYYDDYITGDYAPAISPSYFNLLPVKEQLKTVRWSRSNFLSWTKKLYSVQHGYLFDEHAFNPGYYFNDFYTTAASKSSMDKRLRFQFYSGRQVRGFSDLNLLYLDKIVALCREHGVILSFINPPLHSYYQSRIPQGFIKKYDDVIQQHQLPVIDLKHLPLNDSCFIPDGDHLSVKGAEVFTEALRL